MGHTRIQTPLSEIEYYQSVVVLNAGGTINMSGEIERKPSNAVQKSFDQIRRDMLEKFDIIITLENIFSRPPDSSSIGENEWNTIINKILDVYRRKKEIENKLLNEGVKIEKGGIVITHGTDTIALTSYIIALVLSQYPNFFTIIFTGSHSVIDASNSDAINNLKKSIFASKERFLDKENNLPPGVYVLFGQEIHLCSRITKTRTTPDSDGKYFFSFPASIAIITSSHNSKQFRKDRIKNGYNYRIKIHMNILEYLTPLKNTVLSITNSNVYNWGIVEHLVLDAKTSCDALHDFKRRVNYYRSQPDFEKKKIGIIIQGNFKNNIEFESISAILKEIIEMQVAVFIGSKEVYLKLTNNNAFRHLGLIHKSITYMKALIKLKWLLSLDIDIDTVIRYMSTNLVGDIFSIEQFPDWINYETFPLLHEIIVVYPNINTKVVEDALKRLKKNNDKNRKLVFYGYGDGHLPTINKSIISIAVEFLEKEGLLRTNDFFIGSEASFTDLIEALTKYFMNADKKKLHSYIYLNYDISKSDLLDELKSNVVNQLLKNKIIEFEREFNLFFDNFKIKNKNSLTIKNFSKLNKCLFKELDICINRDIVDEHLKKKVLRNDDPETLNLIDLLLDDSSLILVVKRLIKDSLLYEDNFLNAIAEIVDFGFNVEIKTTAVKSKTNTNKYEVGCKLMIIGVHSDEVKGWNTAYMKRRNLRNQILSN